MADIYEPTKKKYSVTVSLPLKDHIFAMRDFAERLLLKKNIGRIHFDADLNIVEMCRMARAMLTPITHRDHRNNLVEIFPEFSGMESVLYEIIEKKTEDFQLEYVNRVDKEKCHYFDILVIADDIPGRGVLIIQNVSEHARMLQELAQQKNDLFLYKRSINLKGDLLREGILGISLAINRIREIIQKLIPVPNTSILLMGESGTGKSLAARVIHYSSMPGDAPFIDINCAALPESLIESELFGHEKGAFTHAVSRRSGLLQAAGKGTIFLDEIGELPLSLQVKLLSVIETKKFRRLGSNKLIRMDARLMAASNRDLQEEIKNKNFREDLFHRLNVVSITMPPLRTMDRDVLLIGEHIMNLYNLEFNKQVRGFTESAKSVLLDHSWPGNVRELSNCIERAMIFCNDARIDKSDLVISRSENHLASSDWVIPREGIVLEDVERQLIHSALNVAGGNKTKAAGLLGLTRDTFRYRLEKHQIDQ